MPLPTGRARFTRLEKAPIVSENIWSLFISKQRNDLVRLLSGSQGRCGEAHRQAASRRTVGHDPCNLPNIRGVRGLFHWQSPFDIFLPTPDGCRPPPKTGQDPIKAAQTPPSPERKDCMLPLNPVVGFGLSLPSSSASKVQEGLPRVVDSRFGRLISSSILPESRHSLPGIAQD